jgi:hypothetical protein
MPLTQLYSEVWHRPLLSALPLLLAFLPVISGSREIPIMALFASLALVLWGWLAFHHVVPESHREKIGSILRKAVSGRKKP